MQSVLQILTVDRVLIALSLGFSGAVAWGDLKPMLPYLMGKTGYVAAVHGRISNRLLVWWMVLALLVMGLGTLAEPVGVVFLSPGLVEDSEGILYVWAVLINAAIAMGLGIILWLLSQWAAGDAKMFAMLSLTLPLMTYKNNYISTFPSFVMLFNTFVCLFPVLIIEFLVRLTIMARKSEKGTLGAKVKELMALANANRMKMVRVVLLFLAMFTSFRILRHFVRVAIDENFTVNRTLVYVILFIMFRPVSRLAGKKYAMLLSAAVIGGYLVYAFVFDPTGQAKYELVDIGWLAVSLVAFRAAYEYYLRLTDSIEIPWTELKKGMILSTETMARLREREKLLEKLSEFGPDGLTVDQAESLREWFERNAPDQTLMVSRTIPLGPAIFLGAVVTVLSSGLLIVI